ncbi:hypothetical protein BH10PSE17_BH10PSE17_02490 [soil metagenome]
MDDQTKLAFASVADLTKQLVTLATGVLTLETGFIGAFYKDPIDRHWQAWASWILLTVSIAAGTWVLMAVTGTLAKTTDPTGAALYKPNIRLPAFVQVVTFVAGLAAATWFVLASTR